MDALARCQASLVVLALNRLRPATLADSLFFVADLRNQVSQEAHIGFKAGRSGIDVRLENGGVEGVPGSMRSSMSGESERSYGITAERDGANRCFRRSEAGLTKL